MGHHVKVATSPCSTNYDYQAGFGRKAESLATASSLALTRSLIEEIDEYVNTEDAEEKLRPFLDYRPNIGQHLFPSARTGKGIHYRVLQRVIDRHVGTLKGGTQKEEEKEVNL